MESKRKQRDEPAETLVRWLNGAGQQSRLGLYIGVSLRLASSGSARKLGKGISVREAFEDWVRRVNGVIARKGGRQVSPYLETRASRLGVDFDLNFSMERGGEHFRVVGVNEDSRALLQFAYLTEAGQAGRVRLCPACDKFFYGKRTDQRFCSVACKVGFWQKTPQGKEAKRLYMRKWRADVRKLDAKYKENDLSGERLKESRRLRKLGG